MSARTEVVIVEDDVEGYRLLFMVDGVYQGDAWHPTLTAAQAHMDQTVAWMDERGVRLPQNGAT